MNDLLAELRAKWGQALSSRAGGREWRAVALSAASPVRLRAAIRDRDSRIGILVETDLQHAPTRRARLQAEGISLLDQRASEEGILRLAITLERPELREVFEVLAVDLVAVAAATSTPDQAVAQLVRRLEAWQACLRIRQRGLSREEQAGLIGELVIASLAADEGGLPQALDAWSGPLAALHDFQNAGIAIEVKTTVGISQQIRISRLDQLDSRGLESLLLARVRLQESGSGKTLPDYVADIRASLSEEFPGAVAAFEDKLMRAGYLDADSELYGSMRTTLDDIQFFRVSEEFPRLIRENLSPAIVEATYSLDERQLADHRLREQEFRNALRRMSTNA